MIKRNLRQNVVATRQDDEKSLHFHMQCAKCGASLPCIPLSVSSLIAVDDYSTMRERDIINQFIFFHLPVIRINIQNK